MGPLAIRRLRRFLTAAWLLFWPWPLVFSSVPPREEEKETAGKLTPSEHAFQEAVRLREHGLFLEAERQLVIALQEDPSKAPYYFEMANIYAARHDGYEKLRHREKSAAMLAETARYLEQAVMLDPAYLPAQYNLGVVYKRLGQYEKAREKFRQVYDISAQVRDGYSQINALMQMGATYDEQGFYDEAMDLYLKARELNPTDLSIQAAIDDLNVRRNFPEDGNLPRSSLDGGVSALPWNGGPLGGETDQQGQGLQGVLPYLGSMLFQQFLNSRRGNDVE